MAELDCARSVRLIWDHENCSIGWETLPYRCTPVKQEKRASLRSLVNHEAHDDIQEPPQAKLRFSQEPLLRMLPTLHEAQMRSGQREN